MEELRVPIEHVLKFRSAGGDEIFVRESLDNDDRYIIWAGIYNAWMKQPIELSEKWKKCKKTKDVLREIEHNITGNLKTRIVPTLPICAAHNHNVCYQIFGGAAHAGFFVSAQKNGGPVTVFETSIDSRTQYLPIEYYESVENKDTRTQMLWFQKQVWRCKNPLKFFVGRDTTSKIEQKKEEKWGGDLPSAFLVQTSAKKYVIINGSHIVQFHSPEPVLDFMSTWGSNNDHYQAALTENLLLVYETRMYSPKKVIQVFKKDELPNYDKNYDFIELGMRLTHSSFKVLKTKQLARSRVSSDFWSAWLNSPVYYKNRIKKWLTGSTHGALDIVAPRAKTSSSYKRWTEREIQNFTPTLAKVFGKTKVTDPTGWWMSEKFDGYRAVWTGKEFLSRGGNKFEVPIFFKKRMPPGVPLDGELFMGRGGYESCGIFRRKHPKEGDEAIWKSNVKYQAFDLPAESGTPFEERMKMLETLVDEQCRNVPSCPLQFTKQTQVKDLASMKEKFNEIVQNGGEGLMLREPGSTYEQKRTSSLLKVKPKQDTECKVVGWKEGSGKNKGKIGAYECVLLNKEIKFKVGSGLTDRQRLLKNKIKNGTIITITFMEKTKNGKPRHPVFERVRQKDR